MMIREFKSYNSLISFVDLELEQQKDNAPQSDCMTARIYILSNVN